MIQVANVQKKTPRILPKTLSLILLSGTTFAQQNSIGLPLPTDAIRFEVRRGTSSGKSFFPSEAVLHPLDLEDTVFIRIDRTSLAAFAPIPPASYKPLGAIQNSLTVLKDALESIQNLAGVAVDIGNKRKKILDAGKKPDDEYQKLVHSYESSWRKVKGKVLDYLKLTVSSDLAEEHLNELTQDTSNARLAEYLRTEIDRLHSQTIQALQDVDNGPALGLRLQAALMRRDGSGTPVHLDGYDDGRPGQVQFREKQSFVQSAEQQKEIDQSIETAGKVKNAIDNIRGQKRELSGILRDMYGPLIAKINDLPDLKLVQKHVEALVQDSKSIQTSLTTQTEMQPLTSAFLKASQSLSSLHIPDPTQELVDSVRSLGRAKTDAEFFSAVQAIARIPSSNSGQIKAELQKAINTLAGLRNEVQISIGKIGSDSQQKAKVLVGDFESLRDEALQDLSRYLDLATWITEHAGDEMSKLARAGNLLEGVETSDWKAYVVPLNQVRDTWIDMNTVPAADGDKLVVTAEVLSGDTSVGTEEVISSFSSKLPVGSLGWSSSVSGDLLFVQRERRQPFVTATGVSYIYRYRPWDQTTGWNRFLTVVNPGVGLTFATLNFPGNSIQMGVGLTATFFKGIFSVGYGRNLQETGNPRYIFFGLRFAGMSERLRGIGF